jgi:hypothetical protein
MSAPLDQTKFAAAKLNLVLGVGLDAELPKLALRVASVLVGQYMCADKGGEAWMAVKTLCGDLGITSESKVRDALYALLDRGHLVADRKAGETTRYRIADRYLDGVTQPQDGAGSVDTQPQDGADTQPQNGAPTQPQDGAGTQPRHGATNSGNTTPGNELREMNSGKGDSPPTPSHERKPAKGATEEAPPRRKESSPRKESPPDGFEEFWAAYPRHVGKRGAEKAYQRAIRGGATPKEITLGAMRYAAVRDREPDPTKRAKFTAHPATWLNDGRWADDPTPQPAPLPPLLGGQQRRRQSPLEMALAGRV